MTYYVMGVGRGVQNPISPQANIIFLLKVEEKKGRNRREMFTFFTLLILVKLFNNIGVGIIYFGLWGGGAIAGEC